MRQFSYFGEMFKFSVCIPYFSCEMRGTDRENSFPGEILSMVVFSLYLMVDHELPWSSIKYHLTYQMTMVDHGHQTDHG